AYYYGTGANKEYLVLLDYDLGAFGLFDNNLTYEGAYYTDDAVGLLESLFTIGLKNETDVFTTGGASPKTLTFDFRHGTLTYGGENYPYFYNYEFGATFGYPVIQFLETTGTTVTAVNSVQRNGHGLFMETVADPLGAQTVSYSRFISQAVYEELLGAMYVYHGPLFDETILLDTDGKLYVDSTNLTSTDAAVIAKEYNYGLERFVTGDEERITIVFSVSSNLNVYIHIWNRQTASITDIYYARADFAQFLGSYHNGADVVTLNHDGSLTVRGTKVTVTRFETDTAADSLTVKYTLSGTEYTAVFTSTGLTIGTKPFEKFEFDTAKFVGTYTLGDDEIVVTSVAASVNTTPTLTVTFNGMRVSATLSLTQDGKQQLSFGVLVLRDVPLPPPPPPMPTYTLTLDGDTITVSDGTDSATKDVTEWSYGDFALDENKTVLGKTLVCLLKEDGTAPLFFYDGVSCSAYTVSIASDGTKTLTVMRGVIKITLTLDVGNVLTVTGEDTSAPPAPPLP
nr:hypothetical protein [Clostridiales bacterium]